MIESDFKATISTYWEDMLEHFSHIDLNKDISEVFKLNPICYKISEIHDAKVVANMPDVAMGEMYAILDKDNQHIMYAEVSKIEANNKVTLFPLGSTADLSRQCKILQLSTAYTLKVGTHLKGKVLDGYGNVIHVCGDVDNKINEHDYEEIELNDKLNVPTPFKRKIINTHLLTGVKALDIMVPCGMGQRLLICAQPGVGKTTLLDLIAQYTQVDIVIVNLVGERGREVNEFFSSLDKSVLNRSIFILSTSNRPYLEQVKSVYTAHTIAAWFRNKGYKVLLLVDSLTRFARALREVSLSNGAMVVRGYTNSVFSALPQILEIAGNDEVGSITGLYTALFETDSLTTDPLVEEIKSITDGHIVLSRKIANTGRYPAVNFLESISRVTDLIVNKNHIELMRKVTSIYSSYADFELLIRLGEYVEGTNAEIDLIIKQFKELNQFFSQSSIGTYKSLNEIYPAIEAIVNQ